MEIDKNINIQSANYESLLSTIGNTLDVSRQNVAYAINTALVQTYWKIGCYIVEYEQNGCDRAAYGKDLINRLSRDLTSLYGKGLGRSNLQYFRRFYLSFPNSGTLSRKLTWSHYYEILKADDPLELAFYTKQCEIEHWSVRELKRQMKSMLFHRLALSKDKEGVLALAQKGAEVQKPEDIIRDPMVLDFLNLPQVPRLNEGHIETAIINQMTAFLLELGKGFAFVARQYHIMLGGRHFHADLVFYHCILKTYVIIDIKRGMVQHEDIGQMNLYINYFKNEVCTESDTEPIGIVLGAYKDKMTVDYALQGITNQLFVTKYQLYLPDRQVLKDKLAQLVHEAESDSIEQKESLDN